MEIEIAYLHVMVNQVDAGLESSAVHLLLLVLPQLEDIFAYGCINVYINLINNTANNDFYKKKSV